MRKTKKKLGAVFTSGLVKVTNQFGHFKRSKIFDQKIEDHFLFNFKEKELENVSSWRLAALAVVCLVVAFGLFVKIFHLQIVEGYKLRQLADSNRVQIKMIHAPRGVIYDRKGQVLAENNPGFRVKGRFISRDEALKLESLKAPQMKELEIDTIRAYPGGVIFSHVLGYVGEIIKEELEGPSYTGYSQGDRIGRAGIEQTYEKILKGEDGAEILEIDAEGNKLRSLRKIDPVPGSNIHLSIDADLQKVAYDGLKAALLKVDSCCGVVVVEDPHSGEILTLVSIPTYDANAFNDPQRLGEVEAFFTDKNSPLLNRAIGGGYPPGSTFKITTSLAGLFLKKIDRETKFEDTGVMYLGPFSFSNWYYTQYGKKEGVIDIIKAIQRSNDIYFYKVGQLVGEKGLGEVAKKIGFGKKLGIDILGEIEGLVPDDKWKRAKFGEVWYPGDTLHLAIGQGFILTTPLQITAQSSFIAANGKLMTPHLAIKATDPDGIEIKRFKFDPIIKDTFKKEDLELIKKGLSLVPKTGGTAWPFFNFSIPTAGKTGTAEFGDLKDKTHAWYTSYAPIDNPKLTVTVLIEAGGEGSSIAAPIAKQIYNWYFNPDKSNLKSLDIYPDATESAR